MSRLNRRMRESYEYDDLDEWLGRNANAGTPAELGFGAGADIDEMAARLDRRSLVNPADQALLNTPMAKPEPADPDLLPLRNPDAPRGMEGFLKDEARPRFEYGSQMDVEQDMAQFNPDGTPAEEMMAMPEMSVPAQPADDFDQWIAQQAGGGQQGAPQDTPQGGGNSAAGDFLAALADGVMAGYGERTDFSGNRTANQRYAAEQRKAEADAQMKAHREADVRDREARLMDPDSPENANFHRQLRQLLGDDFDPSGMTLHDWQQQGSDLVGMQHAGRLRSQRAAEAQRQGELKRRQMMEDEARHLEQQRQRDIETGNTADEKRRRAALAGGMRARAAEDAHKRRMALEEQKEQQRKSEKLDEGVRKLADGLRVSGLPSYGKQLARLRADIDAAKKENGGRIFPVEDDVLRRMPEASWAAMDERSQRIARGLQKFRNIEIKDLAGAAVATSEMQRIGASQSSNIFDSEGSVEDWFGQMEGAYQEDLKNVLSGAGPDVYKQYLDNKAAIDAMVSEGKGMKVEGGPAPKAAEGEVVDENGDVWK